MALNRIWVYAEAIEGRPTAQSLELLAKARSLGAGSVEAFYLGGDAEAIAPTLGAHGATRVYATGGAGEALSGPAAASAMAALVQGGEVPDLIMFGTTYDGRDVLARLSVKLDRPTLTNGNDIVVDGDEVRVVEAIFGGNTLITTAFRSEKPYLAMFRPKSFAAEEVGGGAPEVVQVPLPDMGQTGGAKVLNRHVEQASGPKLDEADLVVSGGRGLGEAAKYDMVEQLARMLKGAPGASRAIVDAGWVPYSYQVGQTGKVVKPNVYLALGISGATQHMVGMKGSKNIVAINKDRDAPIFGVADLGIVGDVHKVVPRLIELLQQRG